MIFLVGVRRSGTNWLQRTLAARPDVAAVPSETYLLRGVAELAERIHHAAPASPTTGFVYMEPEAMRDALRDLCDAVFLGLLDAIAPEADRLVERTPDHVRHLSLIGEIYPDARIVHIIRDGRDVVRSLLSQEWGPTSVEEAAEEWRSGIAAARGAASGLTHYREVRYEEILRDPRAAVSDLFGWLGLPGGAEAVEAALTEAGVRFNVDPAAPTIGSEKWRESFSKTDLNTFSRIAGDTLSELGYADAHKERPARQRARRMPPVRRLPGALNDWRERPRKAFYREATARSRVGQYLLDRVLDAMASQRFQQVAELLDPAAYVRIVEPDAAWDGRGSAAREHLIRYLSTDPALHGRTVRGDVHPAVPTSLALVSYRLPDGSTQDRLVSISVEGDRITRFTYYRLPFGTTAATDTQALEADPRVPRSHGT